MKRLIYLLLIFITLGSNLGAGYCKSSSIENELIIKYKSAIRASEGIANILSSEYNIEDIEGVFRDTSIPVYLVRFKKGSDITAIANRWKANDDIEYVHPNYFLKAAVVPDDEYFNEQWALEKMNASAAWDIEQGTCAVIIAVPDTGIDLDHSDLSANIWVNDDPIDEIDNDNNGYIDDNRGWNFTNGSNEPYDDNGHGSAIAGVIAATTNNGMGIPFR